ncbi:hypothetical protein ACOSP7_024828 [Xanthoceras sorbifolium]|uniref:MBD domain-containing protein n=1 Tax=Xanthoceras sorbifolium TaxID=99658 RepID=A0ABQ8H825_9ROSI|nr:hypothetical protein JRO89_XS13G0126400 [Xanthoceras sorbifolium]
MSTTTPSQTGHDPTLNSHQPGPLEPENLSSNVDLPPDPLLDSGSFIDANPSAATSASFTTATNDPTLDKREPIIDQESAAPANSNGAAESVTTPEKTPQRQSAAAESVTTPDKPPRRRSTAASSTESLNWLPPGWKVEDRVRTSGATAGMVDKYYFDPVSGHRFRSKKEVLYFLEFGTKRKRKVENSDPDMESLESSGSRKQKKSGAKGNTSTLNFDFENPPKKIRWVVMGRSEDTWTPFTGKDTEKVSEPVRQAWAAAFKSVSKDRYATC